MLPPRYLLREDVVLRLIGRGEALRIADIGCGGGEILVALARLGHQGVGYDPSAQARRCAAARLRGWEQSFRIVERWPADQRFDVVLLLEVLGYAADPVELLRECRGLLKPGGRLLLSFVRPGAGYDPHVVREMRSFSEREARLLLREAGFADTEVVNYGFPLANALVGVMNRLHGFRLRRAERRGGDIETGLFHTAKWLAPLGVISNRWTLKPFFLLQGLFAQSSLGNGYVARARR